MIPLSVQFYSFFLTVAIGFVIGMTFDLYRVVRGIIQPRKIVTNVGDLFFWVIITGIVFALLMFGNWGEVRFYVFVGLAVGLIGYLKLFSNFTVKIFVWNFNLVHKVLMITKKVIKFIIDCITYPFKLFYRIVIVPIKFIKKIELKMKARIKSKINKSIKKTQDKTKIKFKNIIISIKKIFRKQK